MVGMAFRFPGDISNEGNFSQALQEGRDLVCQIDSARCTTERLLHPKPSQPGRSKTFAAGVLTRLDEFDVVFFGISPREAARLDPQQRLLLELTWEKFSTERLHRCRATGKTSAAAGQKNELCDLHYQIKQPRGKLVRAVQGTVFVMAVDIRRSSFTFGRHVGMELSDENKRMLWVPEGFAHGFLRLSDTAEFLYKNTDYWAPEFERSIARNDPAIGIQWPIQDEPSLSEKHQQAKALVEEDHFA